MDIKDKLSKGLGKVGNFLSEGIDVTTDLIDPDVSKPIDITKGATNLEEKIRLEKSTPNIKLITPQEESQRDPKDLDKSFTDYYLMKTADPEYKSTIENISDVLTGKKEPKAEEKKTPPIPDFPFDRPSTGLLSRISKYGLKQQPIIRGGEDFTLSQELDEPLFKRKTKFQKMMETYEKSKAKKKKKFNPIDNVEEVGDLYRYTDYMGNQYEYDADSLSDARKLAVKIDDKMVRIGAAAFREASEYGEAYTSKVVQADGDLQLIAKAGMQQAGREYWRNHDNIQQFFNKNPDSFLTNYFSVETLAGLETLVESPITILAPSLVLGLGQPVADTVDTFFGGRNPALKLYTDLANMNLDNEIFRFNYSPNIKMYDQNPSWTSAEPYSLGTDPNTKSFTPKDLLSNKERRRDRAAPALHRIVPDFIADKFLTLGVLYPAKFAAKRYTQELRDRVIDEMGYKLAEDGKSYVLKKAPKKKFTDKPAKLSRSEVYLRMAALHKEDVEKAAEGLQQFVPRFLRRIIKEQQFMYGTNPVNYLKSINTQVFGENAFVGMWRMAFNNDSLLSNKSWLESATTAGLEFVTAGVGNIMGSIYTKFNVTGRVVDGIKYPFYKVTDKLHDANLMFKFIPDFFAPGGFNPKRDLSAADYQEFLKLDKGSLDYFKQMTRDIAEIRRTNPDLAIEMDRSYEFFIQLRKEMVEANKKVAPEFRFNEKNLTATLGTIFQLRGLNIMHAQLVQEMAKSKMSKAEARKFIQATDIAGKKGKELTAALKSQLDALQVMTMDESNQAINILKKHVELTYNQQLTAVNASNNLLAKAVRIKLSEELFDLNLTKEDADVINELLEEHELLRPDDPDFKEITELNNNIVKLKAKISKNYLGGVKNAREKLVPDIAPSSQTATYNTKIYTEEGKLSEKEGVLTIVNKNVEAAGNITRKSQENALDILNNITRHYQLHYGGLYDDIIEDIPEEHRGIDLTKLLLKMNTESKPTRAMGAKESSVDMQLKRISDDILNIQLEEAYQKAYNSAAKAAEEAGENFTQTYGGFKKEIKEELISELNLEEKIGRINKIDELENLQKYYEGDFKIVGDFKALAALKRTVNKELRNAMKAGDKDKVDQLEATKNAITDQEATYVNYLSQNVEGGPEIAMKLDQVDELYRANVKARFRKSRILEFLEGQGESTGDSLPPNKNEASELLLKGFDDVDSVTGLKVKTPKKTVKFTKAAKQEKLFDWIFENIPPEKMEEELQTIFGLGKVEASDTGSKVVYEAVTNASATNPAYQAFLENYDMWAAAKIAKMLDESIAKGGTKIGKTIIDVDNKNAEMWRKINDKIEAGDVIGQELIQDKNLELLRKMQAFENATNGKMRVGRGRHFEMLQEWMLNNEKLAEGYEQVVKLSDKVIERRTVKIEQTKATQNKVIKTLESKAKNFVNLNDPQQFFEYAMRNKQAMKEARDAAVESGMNPDEWDAMTKRLLIKALIQRNTIGTAKGKIKYETIPDNVAADDLARKNGMDRSKIKKVNVKVKNSDQEQKMLMGTHKELDGLGMVDDIEEYGESLSFFFGENDAVLEHFKIIAKIGSFVDADEATIKSIKSGKFARGVTLSIPMIQSRLWAIMSKRASYHYALSEGLLAFANGRSLDTAYAFLNADAEVSGAMAKMLTTGETKFAAELDPKLAMAFYADTMVGLAELQEGYADYLRAQDPYRKMLAVLFELNPDKSPEGLYPAPEMAPKRSLKDDASLEDGYLLQNRRAYFKEISKRFLDKIKKGPGVNQNLTMQDIFNEAFAEYQAQSETFTP